MRLAMGLPNTGQSSFYKKCSTIITSLHSSLEEIFDNCILGLIMGGIGGGGGTVSEVMCC